MRRHIQEGWLGEVYQIMTRRQSPFRSHVSDVGVVKDLATHGVDLAAWVAGSPYVLVSAQTTAFRGVSADQRTKLPPQKSEPSTVVEENFRGKILSGPNDYVTMNQGLQPAETTEAILQSAESGEANELVDIRGSRQAETGRQEALN